MESQFSGEAKKYLLTNEVDLISSLSERIELRFALNVEKIAFRGLLYRIFSTHRLNPHGDTRNHRI